MSLSIYEITIPVMISGLRTTSSLLKRGAAFASQSASKEAAFINRRLWPDMMPLSGQIQRASDVAKFAAVRVGRVPNVVMSDTEETIDALQERLTKTIAFLEAIVPKSFDDRENAEVMVPAPGRPRRYTAKKYLLEFALPNFWFHVTTVYDLLRHDGAPIGERHFLGWE